ncbi:CatA-like O-acetyltransferase [Pseudoalteromonas fenneropenaei]|uniref:CatA-like O-acetyltransferase n=1 Tax=Pseudoalteromonas fenneropenaei TaxID=1737459 RepID=A0ABV7CIA8_9GAMM
MNYRIIDLNDWPRADHFKFFAAFTRPYFNVCVKVNMKQLYLRCKAEQISFTSAYLYVLNRTINDFEPMRLRILDGQPVLMENNSLSVVSLAEDETFRFVILESCERFSTFQAQHQQGKQISHQEALFSPRIVANESRLDVSHVSILPWLDFTGFSHASSDGICAGIPKCVFGRFDVETGHTPLSIDVHHALMDGLHVAKFIDKLQKNLDELQVCA